MTSSINGLMSLKSPGHLHQSVSHKTSELRTSSTDTPVKETTELKITDEKLNNAMEDHSVVTEKTLTLMEKLEIQKLQQLERSVREHERAHLRSARDLALSSPGYDYERGPDGQKYAVGGEVHIDGSISAGDAEETIEKTRKVQNAALAPSDPSPKDRQAASQARIIESKAHRKLSREQSLEVTLKQEGQDPLQKNLPENLNPYKQNIELQRNLSNMLDLFT
ncbi:MAG: hypothetical protein GY940_08430 [bacterium]|nr:hypothetical protein [bacterium]